MKASFDIPDELYRRAKARSAREGRPLRLVAVELLENWVSSEPTRPASAETAITEEEIASYPWLAITAKYHTSRKSHDLDDLRESIARGWAAETAEKFGSGAARP